MSLRETLDRAMPEKAFQEEVVRLAEMRGWRIYHPFDSRHSAEGYPDLTMVRDGTLIFAELKAEHGRVSADQAAWQEELLGVASATVGRVKSVVWRPRDWDRVVATLA